MARFTKLVEGLSETFRRSGARSLNYFHTDHFEPWRAMAGRIDVSDANGADVADFVEQTSKLDYARKLTLFLKPAFRLALAGRDVRSAPGDGLGFRPLTDREDKVHDQALRCIAGSSHELQVHLHHEHYTRNEMYSTLPKYNREEPLRKYLAEITTTELDEARFQLLVDMTLELYRKGSGLDFKKWFFVHGMWALNGSDRDVCTIDREIGLLLEKGCVGDFTFPAGRVHTDPIHTAPFFCESVPAAKCYDLPQAHPAFAYGAEADGRFFIWASVIKHLFCSIDYYSREIRAGLEDIERVANELVQTSVFLDGNLYLKTHSHSMNTDYFDSVRRPIYPHFHPGVQALLGSIFDGASDAGLQINFKTASEIYDDFVSADFAGPREIDSDTYTVRRAQTAETIVNGMTPLERLETFGHLVNAASHSVVSARIAQMGVTESGAYPYYEDLLRRDSLVHPYEVEVAKYIARRLPDGSRIHELGAGFASMGLLLAVAGYDVLGIDADPRRLATAGAIRAALSRQVPWVAARLNLKEAAIPQVFGVLDCQGVTAVATDVTSGTPLSELPVIVDAAAERYDSVVFDVERFFARARTQDEVDTVRSFFGRHFEICEPVTDAEVGRLFLHARHKQAASVQDPSSVASAEGAADAPSNAPVGPIPTLPMDLRDAAAMVDEVGVGLISDRIARLGLEGSGAGAFYDQIVRRGHLAQAYDRAVAGWILANIDPIAPILEVGAGVGALSLTLSLCGRTVVALDLDARRVEMGKAIKAELSRRLGQELSDPRFVEMKFPASPSPVDQKTGVVVVTNMVFGWDEDEQRAMLAEIARFGSAVVDADRFGVHRRTEEERNHFDRLARQAGMSMEPLNLVSDMRFVRLAAEPGLGKKTFAVQAEAIAQSP